MRSLRLAPERASAADAVEHGGGLELWIPKWRCWSFFLKLVEGKTVKNRVHADLAASDYELETGRLIKLGAVKLNDYQRGSTRWTTFADPEGNEFDLVATTP